MIERIETQDPERFAPEPFDVLRALGPVRSAMRLRHIVRSTVLGLGGGAAAGVLLLLIARFWHLSVIPAVAVLVLVPLGAFMLAILRRPDARAAARTADRYFDLRDRLTTALEYRDSEELLAVMQRQQAARMVTGLELEESVGKALSGREVGGVVLALAATVALLAWSGPPRARPVSTTAAATMQIRQIASAEIPAITRQLGPGHSGSIAQARLAMARLQARLQQAQSRPAALRAISVTQERLQQIRGGLHPVDATSANELRRALARYIPKHTTGSAESQAAAALNNLANKTATSDDKSRAQQTRDLEHAANVTHDTHLRSLLHKASSSLGYGDKRAARSALHKAAARLARAHSQRQASSRLQGASNRLDQVKNQLASPKTGKAQGLLNADTGDSGRSSVIRSSGRPLQQSPSQKRRVLGTNPATGKNGTVSGQRGNAGGFSAGKQRSLSGTGDAKRYGQVYVPGMVAQGSRTLQVGPNGQVQQVPAVPYQQVIARYSKTARQAMDQTRLPPSLQTYVRKYFVVLSHS